MNERCSRKQWINHGYYQCYRKAAVFRNGRWYCKQHDPGDPSKAQTWWRANPMNMVFPVEAVQIVKETPDTVKTTNGITIHKTTETAWVRPTFEEARTCLVGYYTRKITDLASQLEYAERNLEAARKMEEPTP